MRRQHATINDHKTKIRALCNIQFSKSTWYIVGGAFFPVLFRRLWSMAKANGLGYIFFFWFFGYQRLLLLDVDRYDVHRLGLNFHFWIPPKFFGTEYKKYCRSDRLRQIGNTCAIQVTQHYSYKTERLFIVHLYISGNLIYVRFDVMTEKMSCVHGRLWTHKAMFKPHKWWERHMRADSFTHQKISASI